MRVDFAPPATTSTAMGKSKDVGNLCEAKIDLNAVTRAVPDGGWAWCVSFASFVVQFVILGVQCNIGLLHVEYLKEFQQSSFLTGWVSSLALGNMYLFAPLTSFLCEKYGCRRVGFCGGLLSVIGMLSSSFVENLYALYFTFGIVYGVGTSLCYFPTLRTLPYWFSRHLALANGIATAGGSIGSVVVGPVLGVLIRACGWRNTSRIFAGIMLIPTLASFVFCKPENADEGRRKDEDRPKSKIFDPTVLKNPAFLSFCFAVCVLVLGYFVPSIHIPRYALDMNVSKTNASYLVGIMSIGSTFGRLFFGKLSDHPHINRLYLYQMSFLCMGILDVLVPQITSFTGLAVYMVSLGIFDGCFIVLVAIVVSDIVGIEKVSSGMAFTFSFGFITTFVGTPFAGWLVDISGSYDLAFYCVGGSSFIAAGLLFFVPICMPADVRLRNRTTFVIADEEMAEEEQTIWEKKDLAKSMEEKDQLWENEPMVATKQVTDTTQKTSLLEETTAMAGGGVPPMDLMLLSSV